MQNNITSRTSYKLISGKGSRGYFNELKPGKLIGAWGYVALLLIIAIGIPYFSVTVTSLIKLRGFGMQSGNYTFDHYITLFTANPRGLAAFKNSIFFAVTSATIATVIGTAAATIIHYAKNKFLKLIHVIGLMPEMLPNIVFVIGIMIFWNTVYHIIPMYNSIWIIVLAYVTLFLPFSIQYVTSSYSQIGDNLVWAGKVFGGTPAYIFRRITFPLLLRGIFVGWMMIFVISFRELVTASIIAPPNTPVVSTFIMREFEQGSVSVGMAMAVISVIFTTGSLIIINKFMLRKKEWKT